MVRGYSKLVLPLTRVPFSQTRAFDELSVRIVFPPLSHAHTAWRSILCTMGILECLRIMHLEIDRKESFRSCFDTV